MSPKYEGDAPPDATERAFRALAARRPEHALVVTRAGGTWTVAVAGREADDGDAIETRGATLVDAVDAMVARCKAADP